MNWNHLNKIESQEEVEEDVYSFFLPKLTKEELKLVAAKNEEHLRTYWNYLDGENPDVYPEEMKKSDSKDKYVHCSCWRETFLFNLDSNQSSSEDEISSESSSPEQAVEPMESSSVNLTASEDEKLDDLLEIFAEILAEETIEPLETSTTRKRKFQN